MQYTNKQLDSRFRSLHMYIVQMVKSRETPTRAKSPSVLVQVISGVRPADSAVSGWEAGHVDWIREPDVQSLVVLCQGGVMVVHDQILQRLVEIEWLDESVATLRVANHAMPHLVADPVDEEMRVGLGKLKLKQSSKK